MTAAQNITWADETICESNPWHLVNTNLATALDVSLAKRFINGMSSPDEDLRGIIESHIIFIQQK